MTITREHVCEGTWHARSFARFWEPGVEEWAREKLYLPEGAHIDAAMYDRLKVAPFREADGPIPGNQLVSVGLSFLWSQLISGTKDWAPTSTTGFTGLAVGTGTTADAVGDTDLVGGSKSYRVCDDTFPRRFGAVHPTTGVSLTQGQSVFGVTYASGEANFSWDEYAVLVPNSSASAVSTATTAATSKAAFGGGNYSLLNRKSPAGLGIKASGAPASLYVMITIV